MAGDVLAGPPRCGRVRLVAVDGPSGAGKSTFAARLVEAFVRLGTSTALVSTDHYATWADPVAWWPRLVAEVLDPLAAGRPASYRPLDWTTGEPRPGALRTVEPADVLVLEGVSAGRSSVRPRLSALCWVEGPGPAERLERAVLRDGPGTRRHFEAWQDFERGWFEVDRTREYVHPNGLILSSELTQREREK
ncbi:uridine kinase family protein [Amycolatopsis thermophila]|uniref:uridine kinase family protein n=1 Tax=Amycolatopsis thermophila TaxID=206084 RepID=UPI0027D87751|nr:uridine kinase [Amycolatopsis thermophila]